MKKPVKSNLYSRICIILESARTNIARSVNSTQVIANWFVGREIVEDEQHGNLKAEYGKRVIADLSERLQKDFGNGYSVQNLFYMRQFYSEYPNLVANKQIFHALSRELDGNEKLHALRGESIAAIHRSPRGESLKPGQLNPNLSWTHYRTLLKVKHSEARSFYEIESAKDGWSARQLERQIDSLLFERLLKSRDKKGVLALSNKGLIITKPIDIIKDPMVLEFLNLPESHCLNETQLETALISKLKDFLLELGSGFAYVGRQKRLTLEGDHFYSDLVFYHIKLKCYVVIDLKTRKLTHGDLGQMLMYVNYFDKEIKTINESPTIGLILCTNKNDAMAEYVLGEKQKQIFTSRYQHELPTVEELRRELQREMELLADSTRKINSAQLLKNSSAKIKQRKAS